MQLQTISEISRALGLSTRALRYYEQIGLIVSEKKEGYAYAYIRRRRSGAFRR